MSDIRMRQHLETWVSDLNKEYGWNTTVDDRGLCAFEAADGTLIAAEANEELRLIMFYAVLGDLGQADDPVMLKALLAANYFGAETGPGQLGLGPDGRRLVLSWPWLDAADASSSTFAVRLQQLFKVVMPLRQRITDGTIRSIGAKQQEQQASGSLAQGEEYTIRI